MSKVVPQESFVYKSQKDKDLVSKAFEDDPGKFRTHFIRDIVMGVCKRKLNRKK